MTRYERVLLGGLTCDGDDYYNSEQHMNAVFIYRNTIKKNLYT
jgi:arginine decarboxylase